ncbi:acyltransferase family protein [Photobacterium carnosum]|uniref:acyltransferase family protein n=1 Tax=Photobacterium carnosum TaxID=2023717 RepID=UPI001E622D66|nr:acyltransferase family protein [Photobacterium carnosum]MCD9516954.1 acyltransferase family protein [Photobacterium carnosum]
MKFRTDINGLRAIAVMAVVLFHFNPSWVPGGFAGVDVFFVISGFLMTGLIFRGLENNNFSIINFYVARANRIIPALSVVCLALLVFGWFYLTPLDYKVLGKHVASSMGFVSNIIYWRESGYFDAASHSKWLLHTWSLSVEWQFYMIYPVVLVLLKKCMSLTNIKRLLVVGTVIGFIFSVYATYRWPNPAYFLFPTRAWEMMMGGLAFLYPLQNLKETSKKYFEWAGIALILASYAFISKDNLWPGYLALIPVLGAYLVIIANRSGSVITDNVVMQKVGLWSYSIYLWHWPVVVFGYYFEMQHWEWIGIPVSVVLGFCSYKFVESIKFPALSSISFKPIATLKPLWMVVSISMIACSVFYYNGYSTERFSSSIAYTFDNIRPSPYRDRCHTGRYISPNKSCEYFGSNVDWAVLGDSHAVEIAYALGDKLKKNNEGLKHFSFSGCVPSYGQQENFSKCAKWYNDSVEYIIKDKNIKNVLINHRYSAALFGDNEGMYPNISHNKSLHYKEILSSLDKVIIDLAKYKKNIYVVKPIPEVSFDINTSLNTALKKEQDISNLKSISRSYYELRNKDILAHFNSVHYPKNVHFIDPVDIYCDSFQCYLTKNSTPLYFDDDHPSVLGAKKIVGLLNL